MSPFKPSRLTTVPSLAAALLASAVNIVLTPSQGHAEGFTMPSCAEMAVLGEAGWSTPTISVGGPGTLLGNSVDMKSGLFSPQIAELFGVEVHLWTEADGRAFDAEWQRCQDASPFSREARITLRNYATMGINIARLQERARGIVEAGIAALTEATDDAEAGDILRALSQPLTPSDVPAFDAMVRSLRAVRLDRDFSRALATIPANIQNAEILPRLAELRQQQGSATEARLMALITSASALDARQDVLDLAALRPLLEMTAPGLSSSLSAEAAARVATAASEKVTLLETQTLELFARWANQAGEANDADAFLERFSHAQSQINAYALGALQQRLEAARAAALEQAASAVTERILTDLGSLTGETLDVAQSAVSSVSNPAQRMRRLGAISSATRLEAEGYPLVQPIAARVPSTVAAELSALADGRPYDFRWQQMKLWVRNWPSALSGEAAAIAAAVDTYREERRAAAMAADAGPLTGRQYATSGTGTGTAASLEFLDDASVLVNSRGSADVVGWRELSGDRVLIELPGRGLLFNREPGTLVAPDGTVFSRSN